MKIEVLVKVKQPVSYAAGQQCPVVPLNEVAKLARITAHQIIGDQVCEAWDLPALGMFEFPDGPAATLTSFGYAKELP